MYVVSKSSKEAGYEFHDYCTHICSLETDQCYIVMYNRAWYKSYINAVRHGENQKGYRIFLSGPGEQGKVIKGTTDGNWGDICVLAVGDLYQLPPVGQCPIYMSPQTVHTLNDIAPN